MKGEVSGPLRIALIRQRYTAFGGAERILERTVGQLAGDVQIGIVSRSWSGGEGYRFIRCDPPYLGRVWRDASFARCVCRRLTRERVDLIQSHERIHCCDVYRAGDGVHREWLRQRARVLGPAGRAALALSPYHRYVCAAERRLFESARLGAVICNSDMVKAEILEHFRTPAEKLHVILNGVDSASFHPGLVRQHRRPVRGRLQVPDDAIVILFIGSGFLRKGLGSLLQALAALPEPFHLFVVGRDRRARDYERLASRLRVAGRVRFLGPQEDVGPCYGAADLLALPTLYDPFPNVVLEAMATGLPVIVSGKCGAAQIVRPGENGYLCDALDTQALVAHLQAMSSEERRRVMGRAARETVLPMSLEAMGAKLLALYRRLLESHSRA
jgi:UDP-glucose:(heptosyl)LPS alpha-1,3-glucosyltransferase